jgi:hypothetical protein
MGVPWGVNSSVHAATGKPAEKFNLGIHLYLFLCASCAMQEAKF